MVLPGVRKAARSVRNGKRLRTAVGINDKGAIIIGVIGHASGFRL